MGTGATNRENSCPQTDPSGGDNGSVRRPRTVVDARGGPFPPGHVSCCQRTTGPGLETRPAFQHCMLMRPDGLPRPGTCCPLPPSLPRDRPSVQRPVHSRQGGRTQAGLWRGARPVHGAAGGRGPGRGPRVECQSPPGSIRGKEAVWPSPTPH